MTTERDEYRAGRDVTDQVVRPQTPGMVVSVRLDDHDARELRRYARLTERTVSEVARLAIRNLLLAEEQFRQATAIVVPYADRHFVYGLRAPSRTLHSTYFTTVELSGVELAR